MVPDILIGNNVLLEEMSDTDRAVFEAGYELINQVQREEWVKAVEKAKDKAVNEQGVQFIYPDQTPFVEACMPLHTSVLENNEALRPLYDAIQGYNQLYPSVAE